MARTTSQLILDDSGRENSPFTARPRGIWVLLLPVAVLSVVGSPWEAECAGSPRGK
ncbi:3-phosphoinositide dependent protein kinase 1 [Homo sapiens]|uniref:3-phosphoinositide dependent protein kinase 1 n=1 Tax=Homo sapiens TaxID=9606 RepID=H3BQA3_HUMAN|nr:3-phosphoinositide dependent protein kinase 1 [Homo sapiens]KAI4053009.1 3-phosphoinositide dependent protein kinase 1 [Homo sapiens]